MSNLTCVAFSYASLRKDSGSEILPAERDRQRHLAGDSAAPEPAVTPPGWCRVNYATPAPQVALVTTEQWTGRRLQSVAVAVVTCIV